MSKKKIDLLGKSVGFVIAMDKKGAVRLLNRSGQNVNNNTVDREIASKMIDKITSDDNFFKAFQKLLKENIDIAKKLKLGKYSMTGSYNAEGGSDFWGGFDAGSILSSATNIFSTIKASDAQKKLAEQQAKIEREKAQSAIAVGNQQIEIERIRLEQLKAQQNIGAKPNQTLIYVGIGLVGLLVVGGMIVAFKKK